MPEPWPHAPETIDSAQERTELGDYRSACRNRSEI
jgi:hypothetical protein